MNKNNPLFVDSTKFHGDLIATQIELRKILLFDDETLFVVITNHQGDSKRVQMKLTDGDNYEARVHLNHQTLVSYRFIIEKDGHNLFYSHSHKGRAQYAIIADWEPSQEDTVALPLAASPVPSIAVAGGGALGAQWPRDSAIGIRSLIDKWGF